MQKIGDSTNTADSAGEFTEGSQAGGVQATHIKARWLNTLQRELLNLIVGAGLSGDVNKDSQVLEAVLLLAKAAADFDKIGNKPTTIAGYGITDAYTKQETSQRDSLTIEAIRGGVSSSLDQLSKVALALGNDPQFSSNIANALSGKAAKATTLAGYGITDSYTATLIDQKDSAIRGSVPGSLDQLAKIAAAINNDPQFAVTVSNMLAGKAAKATTLAGYGISNAYTTQETDQQDAAVVSAIRGTVSGSLDQLGKISAALNNDPQFSANIFTLLAAKAAKATTLAGYGITDAYNASQIDGFLNAKMSNGAYGLGGYCPVFPNNNLNAQYDGTSWFRTTTGCLNCPAGANPQGSLVFHQVWGLGVAQQTFREHVTAREWHRACNAYEFGPWIEVVTNMVGAIQAFASTSAPSGWLVADGSQVLRASYPALLAVTNGAFGWGNGSTTFNLPDLRAEVIRGCDLNRGINPGRALGSIELDALQGHGHVSTARVTGMSGGVGEFMAAASEPLTTSTNRVLGPVDLAGYGSVRVASETRMRNVAMLYCIKY